MSETSRKWQFWIDRGGTFTDIIAQAPNGALSSKKLLSEAPERYDDAGLAGIRDFLGIPETQPIPANLVGAITIGTTVATNALLERKGEPTVLIITEGLEDQLEIGTQARPNIFARRIVKPDMLYKRIISAGERVRADGTVERALDLARLEADLERARDAGLSAVAIVFMHAYAYPAHEVMAEDLARRLGFTQISTSHRVSPLIKIVGRGDTTVADAYLSPVLARYLEKVERQLSVRRGAESPCGGVRLRFMASSGGLKAARYFRGSDAILSGPAGGIVGMAETARRAGFERVVGFDMGGTSTDVSHFSGAFERTHETEIAGVRLSVPMLSIRTVAAGGGSILSFDGNRMRAGPESAGSHPGPLCYRRGGPLTVTDANVMLGKLQSTHFPNVFGSTGREPIDTETVKQAFAALAGRIGRGQSAEQTAAGFLRIAVENMANAIKKISVERGYDVTKYALSCFGAAGGQHACQVADLLAIDTILIHPFSGVLSAYGIALASARAARQQSIEKPLTAEALEQLQALLTRLESEALAELRAEATSTDNEVVTRHAHLRYHATETTFPVPITTPHAMRVTFEQLYRRRFGFSSPEKQVTLAFVEVDVTVPGAVIEADRVNRDPPYMHQHALPNARIFSHDQWQEARVVQRGALSPGAELIGPAIVIEPNQTVVIEAGWTGQAAANGNLILRRHAPRSTRPTSTDADPILIELFNNRFTSIAEQMGEALRSTAQSVNIKERLDFSCALFDGQGNLIANAPHVPVHLGSMDASVAAVMAKHGATMRPGDVYMLNAPYAGGTHLPDITVVTPVFDSSGGSVTFFVASRGHHADVGGIAPGSMSPNAHTIEQEGVYIDCEKLVEQGRFREAETWEILTTARYPARNPAANIADLKAQIAANARGVGELAQLEAEFGVAVVQAYMAHVQDNAEEAVRRAIAQLSDGHFIAETDEGWQVEVRISIDKGQRAATIDFAGTSAMQPTNVNAPEPVTRAAVLYVFRVLAGQAIPMNAGCLRPLTLKIPEASLLKPRYPAAVVAGNVETSQIITNALFAALGVLAPAQGTMNNLTFGNARHQYYETICSGAPAGLDEAGQGFAGAAGVHVHMTNTRLTDPEVLEQRFPVVLDAFEIRRGSGGKGHWNSGDGTRRRIRFLEAMTCSILSGYRRLRPQGLCGGSAGELGRNLIHRRDGSLLDLGGNGQEEVSPGDAIEIITPTGGGFGAPEGEH